MKDAWLGGQMIPGWAAKANFTLGDPHLALYPPVSLILGGLLCLLLPISIAPAAFVWLALVAAGLAMYLASEPFLSEDDRISAGVIYMLSPYMLTSALVRFAAAELLVLALLPLILLWFYRSVWQTDRRATIWLGCFLGLTWITNIPASIVLLYGLLPVAAACAWEQRSTKPVLRLMLAEGLAACLAAFLLLPIWFEQKWLNLSGLNVGNATRLYMLFVPDWPGGLRLRKVIFLANACVAILVIAGCLWKRTRRLSEDNPVRTWFYLALASIFFQLPFTLVLWKYLPEFRFAQFPFRFLALTNASLPPRSLRKSAYALIAITALLPLLGYVWLVLGYARVPSFSDVANGWEHIGYQSAREYLPVQLIHAPLVRMAPVSVVGDDPGSNCRIVVQAQRLNEKVFTVDSRSSCQIRLAISYYPLWRAVDESGQSLPTQKDANGLLLVGVPSGKHTINVKFREASAPRIAGAAISLMSLIVTAAGLTWTRQPPPASI
jgi:hypothetical protein